MLGLPQREVAETLGVNKKTITTWEASRERPALRHLPKAVAFLGYDPFPAPVSLGEQLRRYRQSRGLSQKALARQLGVNENTLSRWEMGLSEPAREIAETVRVLLNQGKRPSSR